MMRSFIRLYVVDAHPITRAGVRWVFRADPKVRIVGEASTLREVSSSTDGLPDVVLADADTPSQLADVATIMTRHASLKVVAFTDRHDPVHVRRFAVAGGAGWVLKGAPDHDGLRCAVRAAAAGETFFDSKLAGALPAKTKAAELSARELEVLKLVVQGEGPGAIAKALGLGYRTVETYRARALQKLNLKSRADLVRHAVRAGWLRGPQIAD